MLLVFGLMTREGVGGHGPLPRGRTDPPAHSRRPGAPRPRTPCTLGKGFDSAPARPGRRDGCPRSPPLPASSTAPPSTSTRHFCRPRIREVHIRHRRDVGAAACRDPDDHPINVYSSTPPSATTSEGRWTTLRRDAVLRFIPRPAVWLVKPRLHSNTPPAAGTAARGPRYAWDAKGTVGDRPSTSERPANGRCWCNIGVYVCAPDRSSSDELLQTAQSRLHQEIVNSSSSSSGSEYWHVRLQCNGFTKEIRAVR